MGLYIESSPLFFDLTGTNRTRTALMLICPRRFIFVDYSHIPTFSRSVSNWCGSPGQSTKEDRRALIAVIKKAVLAGNQPGRDSANFLKFCSIVLDDNFGSIIEISGCQGKIITM